MAQQERGYELADAVSAMVERYGLSERRAAYALARYAHAMTSGLRDAALYDYQHESRAARRRAAAIQRLARRLRDFAP